MTRAKKHKLQEKKATELPVLNPTAAGIDIGATEIYVAVHPAHAEAFDQFYREHFNPYLNFHRPPRGLR
jgi:hypothetical protein